LFKLFIHHQLSTPIQHSHRPLTHPRPPKYRATPTVTSESFAFFAMRMT